MNCISKQSIRDNKIAYFIYEIITSRIVRKEVDIISHKTDRNALYVPHFVYL
jgi:hypothetical protein